ncbi:alpha/beta hydrolase [Actinomadura hibisca]|uniref:alpha/beta hydrolase n=1 Tax=Actinomadura hibisca TaxID=68565 RepID=UPI001FE0EB83|nr:alpha/beta hydrolase [Actinomadura hibisca]
MRKVLVCGAAFAATCISAVAVPTGAGAATPEPVPTPSDSVTATPTPTLPELPDLPVEPGEPGEPEVPGTPTPTPSDSMSPAEGSATPSPQQPTAPAPGATGGTGATTGSGSVVSAQGLMVTPKPPRTAHYAYGPNARQRIDAYWRPAPAAKAAKKPVKPAKPTKPAKPEERRTAATPKPGTSAAPGTQDARGAQGAPAAPQAKPRPAILMLHGGYWLEGDKGGWKYFARRLTNQGFAVFAANYRLTQSAQWPAQRNDTMAALDFIKKHAKKWNVDPNRIVIIGSSAGGMLATQAGTVGEGAQRVRGVVALSPVNTPYLAYQDGVKPTARPGQRKLKKAVVDLVHCVPQPAAAACWKRVEDANSAAHASAGDAPMLLMHSAGDFVPVTHSTGLASALRGVGVPVTVRTVPGAMHGSQLLNDENVYPEILSWVKARTR